MPATRRPPRSHTRAAVTRGLSMSQSTSRSLRSDARSPASSPRDSSLNNDDPSRHSTPSPSDPTASLPEHSVKVVEASAWLRNPMLDPDLGNLLPDSPTPGQISSALKSKVKSRKTSWAWNHFEVVVQQKASIVSRAVQSALEIKYRCKLNQKKSTEPCGALLAPSGGTKTMLRHLAQVHKLDNPNPSWLKRSKSKKSNHEVTPEIVKESQMRLIVMEELPYKFSDSKAYRSHVGVLNPAAEEMLIGSTATKDALTDMSKHFRDIVIEAFEEATHINLTFDGWTTKNHYPTLGSHDGENLSNHLLNSLDRFKITDKIYCITADNAPVNGAIARRLEGHLSNFTRRENLFGCIAHVINLAVKDALKVFSGKINPARTTIPEDISEVELLHILGETNTVISKVVEGGHLYKTRPQFANDIRSSTKAILNKELGLKTDCESRWNALQACIERYLEVKPVLVAKFAADESLDYICLSPEEWNLLECLNTFLKPFAIITSKLSGATLTFPRATPAYEYMIEQLELAETQSLAHPAILLALQPMLKKLRVYHNEALKKPAYLCAVMLDPRKKTAKICPRLLSSNDAIKLLTDECETLLRNDHVQASTSDQPGSDPNSAADPTEWFGTAPSGGNVEAEVVQFLSQPCILHSMDPLDWWRVHQTEFPNLAIAARAILAVPASSVPSEQEFSAAGRVGNDSRGSLKPDNLGEQVCLKSWMLLAEALDIEDYHE